MQLKLVFPVTQIPLRIGSVQFVIVTPRVSIPRVSIPGVSSRGVFCARPRECLGVRLLCAYWGAGAPVSVGSSSTGSAGISPVSR